ncbi:flagellar export chaperone FliS [Thiocystis violacea]|uniref:flagellar export chaperone FliS n=1 Tax=Thiocystis violacea TaxID=13725 RepID=UPI001905518D|nr:flagellar export chaperone FliS [Thiocystis violacea]MBK1722652.1 flagellar export chaperone FliS [Thiocystis violacea]
MYAMRREINSYRESGHFAEAAVADPHRLIQMLFEATLESIAVARGAIANGNLRAKGEQLGRAISIINGLAGMLDHEKGGELAGQLAALYDYMARRLLEGSAKNDAEALSEVARLLREIKSGWDAVPEQLRRAI